MKVKFFREEINSFLKYSNRSEQTKGIYKRRLDDFLHYLADCCGTSVEQVHLEKIYETVDKNRKTLFFSRLDVKLVDQYFHSRLDKSYGWLADSKRSLQNLFLYLHRRYDFPNLAEEMKFKLDEHKQKPSSKDKYVPTRHDLLKFLHSLLKYSSNLDRDLLFFILLMSTGSRSSEIIYTKVKNIDYSNGTIYVKKTKNKTSKYIVLREGIGPVIKRFVDKYKIGEDDYLFNKNQKSLKLSDLQMEFKVFLQKANLPLFTLHKLRHSFATIMAESGTDILVIQQLLGHKKIDSTKTYIEPNNIRNRGVELKVNKDVYKYIRRK
ncbi:tyrosine-type recombinase/integrase [Oceanobacillus sp. CAU 1775]